MVGWWRKRWADVEDEALWLTHPPTPTLRNTYLSRNLLNITPIKDLRWI